MCVDVYVSMYVHVCLCVSMCIVMFLDSLDATWYPLQKIRQARRKLNGVNPAYITRYGIANNSLLGFRASCTCLVEETSAETIIMYMII